MKIPAGFITISEAAHTLNVSTVWIYKLIQSGKLTKYKRMGRTLLSEKQVKELGAIYADDTADTATKR